MRVPFLIAASALLVVGCRPESPSTVAPDAAFSVLTPAATLPWSGEFDRQRGAPITESVEITALNDRAVQEIAVRIMNGQSDGGLRVSSASVLLNGIELVGPNDFPHLGDTTVLVNIGTKRPVVLTTRITGAIGSTLTIGIAAGAPVTPAGATLSLDGGAVAVEVPAGAVSSPVAISAEPIPAEASDASLAAFDFGPDGSTFAQPLTIRIPLPATADVPAGTTPGLFWRNADSDPWQPLAAAAYDPATRTVSGQIDHFTKIAVRFREIRVCPGDPMAVATVALAVQLISEQGTILLCDAEHATQGVEITKALTLGSENPAVRARLRGFMSIRNTGQQPVVIQDVNFIASGISVAGDYRLVEIRRASFDFSPNFGGNAIYIFTLVNPASRVIVSEVSFVGGSAGIFAPGRAGFFEVRNSTFRRQGFAAIQFQDTAELPPAGASVTNSEFSECGVNGCIRSITGAAQSITLIGNRVAVGTPRANAIGVSAQTLRIENNEIIGLNAVTGDPTLTTSYSITQAGILITGTTRFPVSAVVNGNTVVRAARGIFAEGSTSTWLPITVTGSDNIVSDTRSAVQARGGAIMRLTRNDFVNSARSSVDENTIIAGRPTMSLNGSTLACNWWGSVAGPLNTNLSAVPLSPALFVPIATEPIAGRATVGCIAP